MSRELDEIKASIMEKLLGWQWRGIGGPAAGKSYLFAPDRLHLTLPEQPGDVRQLHFSMRDDDPLTDLNHCHAAELRIIEMGHGEAYAEALEAQGSNWVTEDITHSYEPQTNYVNVATLITAPAEARCRAMLSVLEGV